MPETVKIKDKGFSLSIKADEIRKAIDEIASRITHDFSGLNPLFVVVLNGSFMFASDLFKKVNIPCEISFVKASSYLGTTTTGEVKTIFGLNEDIEGRNVVIIEDIVDTGRTIKNLVENLKPMKPADIKICTLLFKPEAYIMDIKIDYIGIKIPNDFIVGFGLDYDGYGRNFADIYKIL